MSDTERKHAATEIEAVYALLLSLPGWREALDDGSSLGPRIFPGGVAPAGTPEPYVTHQGVSADDVRHLGGRSGIGWERRQVRLWGAPLVIARLYAALRDAVDQNHLRGVYAGMHVSSVSVMDKSDGSEPATDGSERHHYYVRADLRIWYAR